MNQELQQNNLHDTIQKVLEQLLERMNIQASIDHTELLETPCFLIRTSNGSILIGENGQHLYALHAIVKRVVERQCGEGCPPFLLDVNDYQRHYIEEIKERARMNAQRVRYFKKEVAMQPMNSYERRIVHITLSGDPDVSTESIGAGESRRIVIKPITI